MANDFDQFPINDPLVKKDNNKMSDIWVDFMSTFYMNIIGYLTQNGILIPQLTTAQRNTLQTPQNGQMIYNTTLNAFQGFQNGAWKTFTTT